MSNLRQLLQKFATGFTVPGIFLQTRKEIFPIFQEKADILLLLKRSQRLQVGTVDLIISGKKRKAIVDSLDEQTNILIIAEAKNYQEIATNWKRFLPIVRKQIDIHEFIQQESIETKLIKRLEDIRQSLETISTILKDVKTL